MSKRNRLKAWGLLLAAVVLTVCVSGVLPGLGATGEADTTQAVLDAANAYVQTKGNSVTPWGLLAYVQEQTGDTGITLDYSGATTEYNRGQLDGQAPGDVNYANGLEKDFFIKHAAQGMTEQVTGEAPEGNITMNVAAECGAVAAVFRNVGGGDTVHFATAYDPPETEVITLDGAKIAVMGVNHTSLGITTDASGNVTAIPATGVDKIVFPKGYVGSLTDLSAGGKQDVTNQVKVVILNNLGTLKSYSMSRWSSLRSVQVGPQFEGDGLFGNGKENMCKYAFANSKNLKYVSFAAKKIYSIYWSIPYFSDYNFTGCSSLESVTFPATTAYANTHVGLQTLAGTAIRDIFLPYNVYDYKDAKAFNSPNLPDGTRNVVYYGNDMTFVRAATLVLPQVYQNYKDNAFNGAAMDTYKAFVTGSHDAETFRNAMGIAWDSLSGKLTLSYNGDEISVQIGDDRLRPSLVMRSGASVRFKAEPAALRFEAEYYGLDALTAEGATYKAGAIVASCDLVEDIPFTDTALTAAGRTFVDIPVEEWGAEPTAQDEFHLAYIVTPDIAAADYTRYYAVRAYADVTYPDNTTYRFWSDYKADDHARSLQSVVQKAARDKKVTLTGNQKAGLTAYKAAIKADPRQNLYVMWDETSRTLQAVQNYNRTEDFVFVMKPISANEIFNVTTPLMVPSVNGQVASSLVGSYMRNGKFTDSDWLGPHYAGWDWMGGTHADHARTGETKNMVVKVDGKVQTGNVSCYASDLEITWENHLNTVSSPDLAMIENYTLTFNGEAWQIHCTLEFKKDMTWNAYYGMQSVNGMWYETVTFDDEEPVSINVPASGGKSYSVYAKATKCETALLNKGNDNLEMYMDSRYGIGDRRYKTNDGGGAFVINYGAPNSGKMYFGLVGGVNPSMKAGDICSYRGHYCFYYD